MKNKPSVLCLMLAFLLSSPALAESTYSLPQLLLRAETTYPDFHVEKFRHAMTREAAPIARSGLLPQASASWQRQYKNNREENWAASVSVEQVLYNLPEWRLWQAEQERVKQSALNLDAARENLRRDVIIAWLDVQLAAEVLRLVETRRKTLQGQLRRTRALAASGQVIEADVLSARAGLATADSQWAQAKHDLIVAHDVMRRYTDAAAADMQLAADIRLPPLPPLPQWQRQLEDNNLELKAARQQAAFVRRRLQAAHGSIYPRLSLTGSLSSEGSLSDVDDSWILSLRQSLFTGGNLRSQRRQLVAESSLASEQIVALQVRHTQTLKRLHGQMQADLAQSAALSEAAAAAAAFLEVVVIGYDNGVNIITDVLRAEEEVFDAQLNLQQATYSYLKNLAAAQALLAAGDDDFALQIEQFFVFRNHQ